MTAPPEGQKEAPKGGDTLRGAKTTDDSGKTTVGMFPRLVKATVVLWPLWLGSTWLKDRRRATP